MSVISSCRSAERGAGQVEDLAPSQRLELTLRLCPPLGSALEGHEGRLPVQLVFAASASRLQMTARVGLDSPPSIAHATATTIAAPRRLEGSRTPQHDELRVLQHVKKTCSSPFPQRTVLHGEAGTAVLLVFCVRASPWPWRPRAHRNRLACRFPWQFSAPSNSTPNANGGRLSRPWGPRFPDGECACTRVNSKHPAYM